MSCPVSVWFHPWEKHHCLMQWEEKRRTPFRNPAWRLCKYINYLYSHQHAPGVPRILVGNRLHLAFKRQVPTEQARAYAEKNSMTFFEVSPLCNFNVIESFTELSRIVLMRHGMEKFWRPNRGELINPLSLHFWWTRNFFLEQKLVINCTP